MLPPRWVRRIVIAPAVVVGTFFLVTTLPIYLLIGLLLTSLVPGRFRIPRLIYLMTFYLVWDSLVLIALFGMWIASGFGWKLRSPAFQRAHYAFAGFMLTQLFRQARWILKLRITVSAEGGSFSEVLAPGQPLIVASRHAGHWDSFVLVHALLQAAGRQPRIVLKDTLQWDPAIDVMLNRLPNKFIAPAPFTYPSPEPGGPSENRHPLPVRTPTTAAQAVGSLAERLDGNDALVIFPEGGNFTHKRRAQRISRLRDSGHADAAARAESLEHVLPPRPGGLMAALDSSPEADIAFVAHTGLDRFTSLRHAWRELPMDKTLHMHAWRVPRSEVPDGVADRIEWLYGWFATINTWIDEHPSWQQIAHAASRDETAVEVVHPDSVGKPDPEDTAA